MSQFSPGPTVDKPAGPPYHWAVLGTVAVGVSLVFYPVLWGDFLDWDDVPLLFNNRSYRGLRSAQLYWMLTTTHLGHYMPLTWLTYALDYLAWGMNPFGYHLTNVVLHMGNAAVFYFVSLRVLRAAMPAGAAGDERRLWMGAGFAALVFAVHPLRVESVAWMTERRDVLCGLFYLSAILAYLRACDAATGGGRRRRSWYWSALGFFALALLSKSMAVTLPAVLVLLDIYPLGRLETGRRGWLAPGARRVWLEKAPFVLLSLAAGAFAVWAVVRGAGVTPLGRLGPAGRIAVSVYSVTFYLWKTILPTSLSPLYELSLPVDPLGAAFVLSGLLALGISVAAWSLRQRWPGLLAVWAGYLIVLLPVAGIFHNGHQIVADRYSYLPCLSWALLAGAALVKARQALAARGLDRPIAFVGFGVVIAVTATLALSARSYAVVWQDGEQLWRHAARIDPGSALAQSNLGATLRARGRLAEAVQHSREAIRIHPGLSEAHMNLGLALAQQGRPEEAARHFLRVIAIKPRSVEAHTGLAAALADQGRWDEAFEQFEQAVRVSPGSAQAHNDLGVALARRGKPAEAFEEFSRAVGLDPDLPEPHNNLGLALAQQGRVAEAAEQFRRAVTLKPEFAEARNNLGKAQQILGR